MKQMWNSQCDVTETNLITGTCNNAISKFQTKWLNHSFPLPLSHILLPLQLNHMTASSLVNIRLSTDQGENTNTSDSKWRNEKAKLSRDEIRALRSICSAAVCQGPRVWDWPRAPGPAVPAACQIHSHWPINTSNEPLRAGFNSPARPP